MITFTFEATLWKHNESEGAWHFVTLPETISNEIRIYFKQEEEGWGRLKTQASLYGQKWNTSIWYDTKMKRYLLPIKKEIRDKHQLHVKNNVSIELTF